MKKDNLPRWRVDNLWAFIVSFAVGIFSFAGLYFGLSSEIKMVAQKIDFQTQLLQEHKDMGDREKTIIISSLNEMERRLSFIEGSKNSDASAITK